MCARPAWAGSVGHRYPHRLPRDAAIVAHVASGQGGRPRAGGYEWGSKPVDPMYRAKKRRPDEVDFDDAEDFFLFRRLGGLESVEAGRTPEQTVLDAMPESVVKDAIDALPEQFRVAVLLADVEGFSYKEIAEITDVPIGTVMSRLHRGRKQLQTRLRDFAVERGLVPQPPEPSASGRATG